MKLSKGIWLRILIVALLAALAAFPLTGCTGDKGSSGSKGKAGTSKGTLSGTVTNNITTTGISDVSVELDPSLEGVTITTDGSGNYSASLPAGNYSVTYSKTNFASQTISVSILAGVTSDEDVALVPTSEVIVDAGADESAAPGGSVSPSTTVEVLNGSSCTPEYSWTQTEGPTASISNTTVADPTITLASMADYKAELLSHLTVLDRTRVQAVNPLALEEGETATFEVTVTCDADEFTDSINVTASVPWVASTGVRDVPINVAILIHAKDMGNGWDWSIDSAPGGSTANFDNAADQTVSLTPDVNGLYQISVTNGVGGSLINTIDIYAGEWVGAITGQDVNGNPVAGDCDDCHNGGIAPQEPFVDWAVSGHAEIMTQNIDNPAGHWSLSCAQCHTVGYNTDADNNGFDDVATSEGWTAPAHGDPDNWTNMLADFPDVAQLANIQCENCHGPNDSDAHQDGLDRGRISLSADVCGSCHGEPQRHARYQQWEESGHGDYGFVTGSHSDSIGCNCHMAGAFIEWAENDFDPAYEPVGDEFYGENEGEPVTCQACHPPHNPGNVSGEPNNAIVRVEGTTPELKAGFIATGVGRGATCMICHSGRRGPFNTTLYGMVNGLTSTGELGDTLPHHATQGGILMGENAYFVEIGQRSPHSFIVDTCTTCHMELTPPPAELSYNLSGTNHTFEASLDICSECHGSFDGGTLQESVESMNATMSQAIATALMLDINDIAGQADGSGGHEGAVLYDPSDEDVVDGVIDPATEVGAIINSSVTISQMTMPGRSGRFEVTLSDASTLSSARTERFKVWIDDGNGAGTADDGIIDVDEIYEGDFEGAGVIDSTLAGGAITTHGQTIQKAIWNHGMLYMDASKGIHNPGFVIDILVNTTAAMNQVIADLD